MFDGIARTILGAAICGAAMAAACGGESGAPGDRFADGDVGREVGGNAAVLRGDSASTSEGEPVVVDVLANDDDVGGRAPAVTQPPEFGAAEVTDDSKVRYAPEARFDGTDTFRYALRGETGSGGSARVEVSVEGANDPPEPRDDFAAVVEGERLEVEVLSNDVDPEGDDLSLESVESSVRGRVGVSGRTVSYEPGKGFNGAVRLVYRVEDSEGAVADGVVHAGVYESIEGPGEAPVVSLPRSSIRPRELAVLVNTNDSYSQSVASTYASRRGIPADNLVEVELPADRAGIEPEVFEPVRRTVESRVDDEIQGYLLTWLEPYRVGCMSITSAFAFGGYADRYCRPEQSGCTRTARSEYVDAETTRPWSDLGIRPAMMLALESREEADEVIGRGIAADGTSPSGTGYLLETSDTARSARSFEFEQTERRWRGSEDLEIQFLEQDVLSGKSDVLFYLTGLPDVGEIESNTYRPGAVADHMTSFGGQLSAFGGQMSAVEWLRAGVTASYGTVVEPCNFREKFPNSRHLVEHYFRGNTVLEAYWKSVEMPGEGVFIGEPLASPWGRSRIRFERGSLEIRTTSLEPDTDYQLVGRDRPEGEGTVVVSPIRLDEPRLRSIELGETQYRHYTLRRSD